MQINRFLAELPTADIAFLTAAWDLVRLPSQFIINEPSDEVTSIYFPYDGMISLLCILPDGRSVEVGAIGREGAVGTMAGLGQHITFAQSIVQMPLIASRIHIAPFRQIVGHSETLKNLIVRYNDILLGQAQITATCNALHTIQARFARWILQTADRSESHILPLTQEFLSEMLGVHRTSINEIAKKLSHIGAIDYRRGVIEIRNRKLLISKSCECFEMIRQQERLIISAK
jgi:CRP-like cAMP-binding protein